MRCIYCGKEAPGEYCSRECLENTRKYMEFAKKHEYHFLAAILILIFGLFASFPLMIIFPWGKLVLSLICASFGVVMIILPFSTPETAGMLGIKKSVMLVRMLSLMFFVMAAIIYYVMP